MPRPSPLSLLLLLSPGGLFCLGLLILRGHPRFAWIRDPAAYPWELWVIALSGLAATAAGIADYRFHRSGACPIGPRERRSEQLALGVGGVPLFALMAIATVLPRPQALLVPVIAVALCCTVMICYDEFVFHRRRCGRYETLLHRGLVLGNGVAWLAWVHFCFARGGHA